MTPMPNPEMVERLRKELESVPLKRQMTHTIHGIEAQYEPDYQALAEKVAGIIGLMEEALVQIRTEEKLRRAVSAALVLSDRALAALPWRTDAP